MNITRKRQWARACWLASAAVVGMSLWLPTTAATPPLRDYMIVSNREGDVLRFDLESGAFAGTVAKRGENGLNVPYGMTLGPDGLLYVASVATEVYPLPAGETHKILKYDPANGHFMGVFTSLPPATQGLGDLAFGPNGNLYLPVSPTTTGSELRQFEGTTGAPLGVIASSLVDPYAGLSVGSDGHLYVATQRYGVEVYDGMTGAYLRQIATPETSFTLFNAFGPDGLLYVSEYFAGEIDIYDVGPGQASSYVRTITGPLSGTQGLAFDTQGMLYAAAYFDNTIARIHAGTGQWSDAISTLNAEQLNGPIDIVLVRTPVIPEPATWMLALVGLSALGAVARRRASAVN